MSQQVGMSRYRPHPYLPHYSENGSATHRGFLNDNLTSNLATNNRKDSKFEPKKEIEALHLVEEENKVYSITPSTYNANQCQNTAKVRRKLNLNESVDSMPPKALVSKQDSTSISTTIAVQNSTLRNIRKSRKSKSNSNNHVATRMDNSLLVTTKKFIELRKEDNTVNLNEAAVVLNVPKRRLYDITNVLEGVDLVEKVGKNSIRWKTDDGDSSELSALKSQCKSLSAQESELDALLIDLTSAVNLMKEDPTDKPYGYIHLKDIRSVNAFHDQTLIVLKSHPEAQCVIEVTDPTKTHKFQMKMKSEDCSPLGAYICHSDANTVSSIEDFLSSAESSSNVVSARHKSEPTSSTHINDQMVFETNNKVDSSTMDGNTDIVLPKADLRHDSLSDLITPDKVMFQGSGAFPSPLKMLLDPYAQFPNSGEADSSNTLLTPDTADPDPYNFPSSGLSLNDLFSASDWELPQ